MKVRFTERADKDYAALLPEVRKAFGKQLGFLLNGTCRLKYKNPTLPFAKVRWLDIGKPHPRRHLSEFSSGHNGRPSGANRSRTARVGSSAGGEL